MSFHAAGGNVGDTCKIPLPSWVLVVGERNPDVFFTDKAGVRNRECLSLGCDTQPLFHGRSPLAMYHDFIEAFADEFDYMFGAPRRWRAGSQAQVSAGTGEVGTASCCQNQDCMVMWAGLHTVPRRCNALS